MKKFNASLLLVAACTGLVLAGCQKPAPKASTDSTTGTITIQDNNKSTAGSIQVKEATDTTKSTIDVKKALDEKEVLTTDSAKKAVDDANKAMLDAKKTSDDALAQSKAVMKDAGVTTTTTTSASTK